MLEEKQVVNAAVAVRRGTPAVTVGLAGSSVVETLTPVQVEEVKEVVETALESLVSAPAPTSAAPAAAPAPTSAASEAAQRLMLALSKADPKKKYHFVKRYSPADVILFADGSSYTFPLILRNTGGYSPGSELKTDDEKLAANLREAAKNPHLGLVEIK